MEATAFASEWFASLGPGTGGAVVVDLTVVAERRGAESLSDLGCCRAAPAPCWGWERWGAAGLKDEIAVVGTVGGGPLAVGSEGGGGAWLGAPMGSLFFWVPEGADVTCMTAAHRDSSPVGSSIAMDCDAASIDGLLAVSVSPMVPSVNHHGATKHIGAKRDCMPGEA